MSTSFRSRRSSFHSSFGHPSFPLCSSPKRNSFHLYVWPVGVGTDLLNLDLDPALLECPLAVLPAPPPPPPPPAGWPPREEVEPAVVVVAPVPAPEGTEERLGSAVLK